MPTPLPPSDYGRILDACFPPAEWIHEPTAAYAIGPRWSERHLQCVWFDARIRPPRLLTADREEVEVVDPGRWNLEAGPDFLDAVLRIGDGKRLVCGDVEVHVRPSDWSAHGHSSDPRYANVIAHVTYHAPDCGAARGDLPAGCLQIGLRAPLAELPGFSFDDIDLAAYPFAVQPATPRPCASALSGDPGRATALLAAAGRHRFARKCDRMRALLARSDSPEQVFYAEFLAALGYKRNAAAGRALAAILPLSAWRAGDTPERAYARLLGAAGLLPPADEGRDDDARDFLRSLWDTWWHDPVDSPGAPPAWALDATRPVNHPARRLAAAAVLFTADPRPADRFAALAATDPAAFPERAISLLAGLSMDYWTRHASLAGAACRRTGGALVGRNRAAAIVNNLLLPFLVATGVLADTPSKLPAEDLNAPMRTAANHLLGRDHNPALYRRDGLLQQGLLQIHTDFCLRARCGCENCELPRWLKSW
ncbi:MAG: DUF2851 family protein [Kiritimatiellia bacterium]|jgi:hypothetical protein